MIWIHTGLWKLELSGLEQMCPTYMNLHLHDLIRRSIGCAIVKSSELQNKVPTILVIFIILSLDIVTSGFEERKTLQKIFIGIKFNLL